MSDKYDEKAREIEDRWLKDDVLQFNEYDSEIIRADLSKSLREAASEQVESDIWVFMLSNGMPHSVQRCTFKPTIHPGNGEWIAMSAQKSREQVIDGWPSEDEFVKWWYAEIAPKTQMRLNLGVTEAIFDFFKSQIKLRSVEDVLQKYEETNTLKERVNPNDMCIEWPSPEKMERDLMLSNGVTDAERVLRYLKSQIKLRTVEDVKKNLVVEWPSDDELRERITELKREPRYYTASGLDRGLARDMMFETYHWLRSKLTIKSAYEIRKEGLKIDAESIKLIRREERATGVMRPSKD